MTTMDCCSCGLVNWSVSEHTHSSEKSERTEASTGTELMEPLKWHSTISLSIRSYFVRLCFNTRTLLIIIYFFSFSLRTNTHSSLDHRSGIEGGKSHLPEQRFNQLRCFFAPSRRFDVWRDSNTLQTEWIIRCIKEIAAFKS